jgi:hypothetical protein
MTGQWAGSVQGSPISVLSLHGAPVARVRSMLRINELHDRAEAQAAELTLWNRTLEQRVAEQLGSGAKGDRRRDRRDLPAADPVRPLSIRNLGVNSEFSHQFPGWRVPCEERFWF